MRHEVACQVQPESVEEAAVALAPPDGAVAVAGGGQAETALDAPERAGATDNPPWPTVSAPAAPTVTWPCVPSSARTAVEARPPSATSSIAPPTNGSAGAEGKSVSSRIKVSARRLGQLDCCRARAVSSSGKREWRYATISGSLTRATNVVGLPSRDFSFPCSSNSQPVKATYSPSVAACIVLNPE